MTKIFRNLRGHEPYPHQTATYEALAKIRPPLPQRERVRVRGNMYSQGTDRKRKK